MTRAERRRAKRQAEKRVSVMEREKRENPWTALGWFTPANRTFDLSTVDVVRVERDPKNPYRIVRVWYRKTGSHLCPVCRAIVYSEEAASGELDELEWFIEDTDSGND